MSFIGTVTEDGKISVPPDINLPKGAQVRIEEIPSPANPPTIWDKLSEFAGIATDLPSDLAENHDHYAHGAPKRCKE